VTGGQKDIRRRMSDKHEEFLARVFGGDRTPGSGNQWHAQTDGHNVDFAWDAKSTRSRSMTITIEMLDKLDEQSYPRRSFLPIRFYGDERLSTYRDKVLVDLDDLLELLECADNRSEQE
jgi:hypothetical protein